MLKSVVMMSLLTLTRAMDCCQNYCSHSKNMSDHLSFTDTYQERHLIPVGQSFRLDCCTGSLDAINTTWFKRDSKTGLWKVQKLPNDCIDPSRLRYPCEQNQILEFQQADMIADDGWYRCEATDGRDVISRNFTVDIFECFKEADYMKIVRKPDPVLQVEIGQKFRQNCEVEFGCLKATDRDSRLWWSYHGADSLEYNVTTQRGGHYHMEEGESKYNTSKSMWLIIDRVSPDDLHTVFTCIASKGGKSERFNITLREPASRKTLPTWLIIVIVSIVSAVVMIIIIAILIRWQYGPSIKYHWKHRFNKLPPRNNLPYDVMVVGGLEADEDPADDNTAQIADTVRRRLEDMNYRVYRSDPGRSMIAEIDDIPKCVTVIFVIDVKVPIERFLAVVLEPDEELANDPQRQISENNFISRFDNVLFILPDRFRDSDLAGVSEYTKTYKHITSVYTTLKWPGGEADKSNRKCKNFWSAVRMSLPKVSQATRQAEQPLLAGAPEYNQA